MQGNLIENSSLCGLSSSGIWRREIWHKFIDFSLQHTLSLKDSYTLKIEVLCFSETLVAFCKISLRARQGWRSQSPLCEIRIPKYRLCFARAQFHAPFYCILVCNVLRTQMAANALVYSAGPHCCLSFTLLCLSSPCSFWSRFCNMNRVFFFCCFVRKIDLKSRKRL